MNKRTKPKDPRYINRELSWLEFNQRVIAEAMDSKNPLLERVKFFCIANSNLDEFFEVRVAGLKQQIESDVVERGIDGRTATETFQAVTARTRTMFQNLSACWRNELKPALAKRGFHFRRIEDLKPDDLVWVKRFYRQNVRPVLTPLAVEPTKAFPLILNKSLNLIVRVEKKRARTTEQRLCIVQVPRVLPRLVPLPRAEPGHEYVFLADIISHFVADLFPGTTVLSAWCFRVTRNGELYVDEDDAESLLQAVENELRNRRRGNAVRLEMDQYCPDDLVRELQEKLDVTDADVYRINGPVNPVHLNTICLGDHSPELRDPPFIAPVPPAFRGRTDLFEVIRQQDVLVHHPFENFDCVVDFLNQAAADPKVLAIKQTLYRTGGDRRVVDALMRAAQNGKQVTVVLELKARFDEANNIRWARELEEVGAHVSYGLFGYKIHAKLCLVIRQEEEGLRRYLHLSTGNYNPTTARFYTDLGLFTCRPDFGEDAAALFNLLTGFCQFQGTRKLIVAPFDFHRRIVDLIRQETRHAREGNPARIIAKMNSLENRPVIDALYDASKAGVKIDLIVRGICCLRAGVPGLSDNITVRSIVDRFLEHSRIFHFENSGAPQLFLSSGDWMSRNFEKRIEVAFPVEDPALRQRITQEILPAYLSDNIKSRSLLADNSYSRSQSVEGEKPFRSQSELINRARPEFKPVKGSAHEILSLRAAEKPAEELPAPIAAAAR
ncbi:MAG: polyphosphate kinase 1 [Pedosphaera sp.]|nr:polyphosphate kinase 1 [Pedosphaera sp.]MSU44229.1 polyphosphate kinase 1 [Pedosphaera sp.]